MDALRLCGSFLQFTSETLYMFYQAQNSVQEMAEAQRLNYCNALMLLTDVISLDLSHLYYIC